MGTRPRFGVATTDAVLAVAVAGVVVADAMLAAAGAGGVAPLDYVLLLGGSLTLAARRRAPRTVLLITVACTLGHSVLATAGAIAVVPVLIALYTVVAAGHRVVAIVVAAPLMAGAVGSNLARLAGRPVREAIQEAILPVGWFVVALVAGEVSRHRRAYLEQVERRAADAERTREEAALRRAGEERLRIARELHDSLTHSISVIKVHAGVAVHLAGRNGETASDALLAIQAASGDAARELRETLHVLRNGHDGLPAGGLDRLPDLVSRTRAAGLPVTLAVTGARAELPIEVERAVYRIVQESLTNIARHAGRAAATVTVHFGAGQISVQVDDDGTATPELAPVPGVGLIGMRERVSALGGRLRAQPRPEGGFTVRAEIPVAQP